MTIHATNDSDNVIETMVKGLMSQETKWAWGMSNYSFWNFFWLSNSWTSKLVWHKDVENLFKDKS